MIKVIYGKKGAGKTKSLIESANSLVSSSSGDVVFIDDGNQRVYDLNHKVRFINAADFPVNGDSAFLGFLCGIISEDYDIDSIFIDGLTYIVKQDIATMEAFFSKLKQVAEKFNTKLHMSINGDPDTMPEFLKEFVV